MTIDQRARNHITTIIYYNTGVDEVLDTYTHDIETSLLSFYFFLFPSLSPTMKCFNFFSPTPSTLVSTADKDEYNIIIIITLV